MKTQEEVQVRIDELKAIGSPLSLSKARELELVLGIEEEDDAESDMVAEVLLGGLGDTSKSLWDRMPAFTRNHNLYTFSRQKEALAKLVEPAFPPSGASKEEWAQWDKDSLEFEERRRELQFGKSFMWQKLLGPDAFKEAKKLLKKRKNGKYEEGFYTKIPDEAADIENAELVASLTKDGTHRPLLDIDFPATVIPSTTEGHCHLYIDKEMPWKDYRKLLNVLADVGIIEPGYRGASLARGYTALRLPWIKKPPKEDDTEKITLEF